MYQEVLQKIKPDMEKTVSFFQGELAKIRTGQATPSLVEDVQVNLFGQKMPLKQLAGISCPDRGQILIQPWDKSYVEPIEKALQVSSLGTSPSGGRRAADAPAKTHAGISPAVGK